MTKGQGRATKMIEENRARREAFQRELRELQKAGLLPRSRTIPGASKNHRIRISKAIEMETIEANREAWIKENPGIEKPWEKFNMG